jgi:hypothetical protein
MNIIYLKTIPQQTLINVIYIQGPVGAKNACEQNNGIRKTFVGDVSAMRPSLRSRRRRPPYRRRTCATADWRPSVRPSPSPDANDEIKHCGHAQNVHFYIIIYTTVQVVREYILRGRCWPLGNGPNQPEDYAMVMLPLYTSCTRIQCTCSRKGYNSNCRSVLHYGRRRTDRVDIGTARVSSPLPRKPIRLHIRMNTMELRPIHVNGFRIQTHSSGR